MPLWPHLSCKHFRSGKFTVNSGKRSKSLGTLIISIRLYSETGNTIHAKQAGRQKERLGLWRSQTANTHLLGPFILLNVLATHHTVANARPMCCLLISQGYRFFFLWKMKNSLILTHFPYTIHNKNLGHWVTNEFSWWITFLVCCHN